MIGSVAQRIMLMMSGQSAEDQGLALLQSSDSWVSAQDSMVTTVDTTGLVDLRAAPNYALNVTRANIAGPEGELGVSFQESAGVTGTHQYRYNKPTNLSVGYVKYKTRFRTTAYCELDHLGNPAVQRWTNSAGGGADMLAQTYLVPPAKTEQQDTPWHYLYTVNNAYSYQVANPIGDWYEVEQKGQIYGSQFLNLWMPAYRAGGAITGNGQVFLEVASVEFEQSRVAEIYDVRGATLRFSEAANASRQVLAPDLWLNSRPCFVEARNDNATAFGRTPLINAAITPKTASIVLKIQDMQPIVAALGTVIRVGDISLKVGTDLQWHIVQGATDYDTAVYVPAVPVCVTLRIDGGDVDLFVDGQQVATTTMTQGSTGYQIGGDNAEVIWEQDSLETTALSDSEISAKALKMRQLSGLPAQWPLHVLTGQSNAVDQYSLARTRALTDDGLVMAPGWACKVANDGITDTRWTNGASLNYQVGAPSYPNLQGVNTGIFAASQVAQEPLAMLLCAKGGVRITEWLTGGPMESHLAAMVAQAIARFGTHLVEVDTFYFIQGEADASDAGYAAAYAANLEALRTLWRTAFGTQIKIVLLKLSTFTDAVCSEGNTIRAAQDALAAAHPADVATATPTADPAHFQDTLHVDVYYRHEHGKLLYAARQTL